MEEEATARVGEVLGCAVGCIPVVWRWEEENVVCARGEEGNVVGSCAREELEATVVCCIHGFWVQEEGVSDVCVSEEEREGRAVWVWERVENTGIWISQRYRIQ